MVDADEQDTSGKRQRRLSPALVVLLVLAVFAGILLVKGLVHRDTVTSEAKDAAAPATTTSITSAHNDAIADYDAALKTGKPVYVLFHSLS